ncbi:hypothetical protein Z962_05810 [Clostridium botulinum C/D str. BKT12695]|nr:hypothetical protein Z962_05810 [Clostridium botulinum C/D str. BKT12695]
MIKNYILNEFEVEENNAHIEFNFTDVDGNLVKGVYYGIENNIYEFLEKFSYNLTENTFHETINELTENSGPIDTNFPIKITIVPARR